MARGPDDMNTHPLGKAIARGRTADVYAWEDGYVLKLFHGWCDRASIEREARIAQAMHAWKLPVPEVGDILEVSGHTGLVYERVDGPTMLELLQRKPWRLYTYASRLAELQAKLHALSVTGDLPAQRQRLESSIRRAAALPAKALTGALAALASMPDGDRICHGDFHPANILMTPQGARIIDWIDASRGNPLADVARTTILTLGATHSAPWHTPARQVLVRIFHRAYLRHYFRLRPLGRKEYRYWVPITAAARLSESIAEEEAWLVGQALTSRPMPPPRPDP
jgi:Ser/Thr protein kinase RdoA (MazF antagonist)